MTDERNKKKNLMQVQNFRVKFTYFILMDHFDSVVFDFIFHMIVTRSTIQFIYKLNSKFRFLYKHLIAC